MSGRGVALADLDDVLVGLGGTVEAYRGRRIFITGGTGFFGRWLLEALSHANRRLELGLQMVVLTRDPAAFAAAAPQLALEPALQLHAGDIRHFTPPPGRFDYVLHGAATSDARAYAADPLAMLDTIANGTRRVVDFALACGAERMLLVSSGAVYGVQPPEVAAVAEDFAGAPDPLQPATVYAQGKRMAEHICALASERAGLVIPIARCFAFVGAYLPLDAHFAAGNFIRDALTGGPIKVAGDGTPLRSYLYASDLVCWLLTILARGQSRRAYNVGSGIAVSIAELAGTVAAQVGAQVEVAHTPRPGAKAPRYVPDVSRAHDELGLRVRVSLPHALAATIAFHRNA